MEDEEGSKYLQEEEVGGERRWMKNGGESIVSREGVATYGAPDLPTSPTTQAS